MPTQPCYFYSDLAITLKVSFMTSMSDMQDIARYKMLFARAISILILKRVILGPQQGVNSKYCIKT